MPYSAASSSALINISRGAKQETSHANGQSLDVLSYMAQASAESLLVHIPALSILSTVGEVRRQLAKLFAFAKNVVRNVMSTSLNSLLMTFVLPSALIVLFNPYQIACWVWIWWLLHRLSPFQRNTLDSQFSVVH